MRCLITPLAGCLLLLAACATPAQRIERTLRAEGVPPAMARCLGQRLDDRLSRAQLRQLGRVAARLSGTELRELSIGTMQRMIQDIDPTLMGALAGSSFDCLMRRAS